MQIEEIDFEQNTVIFRILKISKKNEVFNFRLKLLKKLSLQKNEKYAQKSALSHTFQRTLLKVRPILKAVFNSKKLCPPPSAVGFVPTFFRCFLIL